MITFTITSCGRLDLLERTLESFLQNDTSLITEWLMTDDSGDVEISKQLDEKYGDRFRILHTSGIGQLKCLDKLFRVVENEYVFHCEDDWEFTTDNFIQDSLTIMEVDKTINQVWVRDWDDHDHKPTYEKFTTDGVVYYNVDQDFRRWNGYSWNPGLRRKSDYLRMFPKGLAVVGDEYQCMKQTKEFNYQAVLLDKTVCKHIGGGRHVTQNDK